MRRFDVAASRLTPLLGRESELLMLRSHFEGRQSVGALVYGDRGVGKSALVLAFASRHRDLFPGGIWIEDFSELPHDFESAAHQWAALDAAVRDLADEVRGHPGSLVILDEGGMGHVGPLDARESGSMWPDIPMTAMLITSINNQIHPPPSFLATAAVSDLSRRPISRPGARQTRREGTYRVSTQEGAGFSHGRGFLTVGALMLPLYPVHRSEVRRVLLEEAGGATRVVREIVRRTGGDIRVAALFADLLHRGETPELVLERFEPVEVSGLLDPKGAPIDKPSHEILQTAEAHVAIVRDRLVGRIADRPELIRTLSPRQFEEFVADLYAGAGFDVELTPASRDGGFDIYARHSTPFGTLLTLIECKRYAPHRPVQVDAVRKLIGVVETEKAHAGVLATTATFTRGSVEYADAYRRVSLQDYFALQNMLAARRRR